jgi:hypothetical protein
MATINVLDAAGATVPVEKPLAPGQAVMAASRPVVIASDQSAIPVSGSLGISGSVAVTGTFWQATQPVSGTGTFAISAASLPLPTGAALDATLTGGTQRTKLTDGTSNAAVKAASTAAVAADPALVVAISPNNTLAATQSGTWNIGSITTLPALVAGSAIIGKVGVDQTTPGTTNAVSLSHVAATAVATGNGVVSAGVQRVAIASDNTAFSVNVGTVNGVAQAYGSGVRGATVQRVTIATDDVVPVTDNGGSLTIDAPGVPVALGANGGLKVDIVGGSSSGTQYTEDVAAAADPIGTMMMGVRRDTLSTSEVSADGDNIAIKATNKGQLHVFSDSIGTTADATVANGAAGTIASYLRTMKDAATDTTTPSPVKIDQTTPGTTNAVSVQTPADVISFTPTLDTSAYASGDVLFVSTAITGVTRANDLRAVLMSMTVCDKSDQKPAFTIYFAQTNVTTGTINVAPTISDADVANILGYVSVAAADWKDLGGADVVTYKAINLLLEAASGTTTVYAFGVLEAGTPTFAASDLVFKFGVVQS